MQNEQTIKWKAHEHQHTDKSRDWFWALWIIAIAGAATAIILSNILFAVLIIVGAFTVSLHATKRPSLINFEINDRGIVINGKLHSYSTIDSFWVDEENQTIPKLLVKSKKMLSLHIIIPLENVSSLEVRKYLLDQLQEEEDSEPLTQKIVEFFGF